MTESQFQQLVALLGQVGGEAYAAAYQYAIVNAVVGLVFFGVVAVAALLAGRLTRRLPWKDRDGDLEIARTIAEIARWFIFAMSLPALALNLVTLLTPQYSALKALAALVTGAQ